MPAGEVRPGPAASVEPAPAEPPPVAALEAEAAQLRLDVEDRDRRIAAMQKEYALMEGAQSQIAAEAGARHLEKIMNALARPLSNLALLMDLADAGSEVALVDLISLARSMERELARLGLERIGRAGEHAAFDIALHQRMSGGAVHPGADVRVSVPGFRLGTKVLLRAMVTSKAAHAEEEEDSRRG